MAGIEEIARQTGVSTATVSRALRGLPNVAESTRETVRQAAQRLGYVASSSAAALATGRTGAIGVAVPTLTRWFYAAVVEGIQAELNAVGIDMVLFNLGEVPGEKIRLFHRSLLHRRVDGVIALCMDFDRDERAQLASLGIPTIVVGGPVPGLRRIGIDDVKAARLATEHLIHHGHREIACLGGEDGARFSRIVPSSRCRGFLRALSEAGIEPNRAWLAQGGFSMGKGRMATRAILSAPRGVPTAIFERRMKWRSERYWPRATSASVSLETCR